MDVSFTSSSSEDNVDHMMETSIVDEAVIAKPDPKANSTAMLDNSLVLTGMHVMSRVEESDISSVDSPLLPFVDELFENVDEQNRNIDTTDTGEQGQKRERGQWTRRNWTADKKKFDTDKQRHGPDRSNAFYRRSMTLITKAKELHGTTKAQITVTIKPLTDRGRIQHYKSPNYDDNDAMKRLLHKPRACVCDNTVTNNDDEQVDVTLPYAEIDFMKEALKTPSKKLSSHGGACAYPTPPQLNSNVCHICRVKFGTSVDDDLAYHWLRCGANGCSYWVHANCVCIEYDGGERGRKQLEAWAKTRFRCKKHQKKPTWDGEKSINCKDPRKVTKKGDVLKNMVQKVTEERKKQ